MRSCLKLREDVSSIARSLKDLTEHGLHLENNFFEDIITQAAGAFFAFLFGLFAFLVQKKRERFLRHRTAVVKLEYLLNEYLDYVGRNDFLLSKNIEKHRKELGISCDQFN